ncbi:tetratricopeptide repeat protein, partial [Helicobacter pylori]|uniref:tetratricopeptide repeat protein n=1 Tax=Helicobacter pylori TaxID=210 RepID=UPI003F8D2AED
YFEKACDLKYGGGCGTLGFLYGMGKGVEKNLIKAAYFYSKACDLNNGSGCGVLGFLLEVGRG